jgi:hypothetical protein
VCSGAGEGNVLRAKQSRLRAKRSSGVEGKAVEGALHRQWHALGIGSVEACSVSDRGWDVEDLKRASGKILLSVERAART